MLPLLNVDKLVLALEIAAPNPTYILFTDTHHIMQCAYKAVKERGSLKMSNTGKKKEKCIMAFYNIISLIIIKGLQWCASLHIFHKVYFSLVWLSC